MNLLTPQLQHEQNGFVYSYTASFDSDRDGVYCDDIYDIDVCDDYGQEIVEPVAAAATVIGSLSAFLMACDTTMDYLQDNYNDILNTLEEKQTTDRIEW